MEKREGYESPKSKPSNFERDLHEVVGNKELLDILTDTIYNNTLDEIIYGVVLDVHRKYKTDNFDPVSEEVLSEVPDDALYTEVFGPFNLKKVQDCLCPNCDRLVAATRFAPHLEVCMGMGRSRSRNATRRVASSNNINNSKDRENTSSYGNTISDDEDNSDWNWGDKRRKRKDKNGSKKKSSAKKITESETVEPMNIDIEGDDDYLSNLRDLLQESSNGSPNDISISSKKKEKTAKNKKGNRKDRSSPNTNFNLD